MTTNEELYHRGLQRIPGGVNSPVRAFRSVGGVPYFVARGEGSRVWDIEGNEYIDYVQSYGASMLGHADPGVVKAIAEAAALGSTFGAPTEGEVVLAEILCDRVPHMEQVRLVSSGTEAAMSAIRLARGVTGRDRIVKFLGNYHGHSDALLAGAGSGVAEGVLGADSRPDSAGVTRGAVADTSVLPYNVVPVLDESVAVVCVEPVAANMGLVAPREGFLEGLRAECDRVGAMLLFDEVITGFRLGGRRCLRLVGRHAGPVVLRQGDRRWTPGRRVRSEHKGDVAPVARRRRVPGGHVVGEPAGHRRRSDGAVPARRRRT